MIRNLRLLNYRNLTSFELEFDEKETLILWGNWQWKTSIIEAVHFLSIWRPFRTNEYTQAIKDWSQFANISSQVWDNSIFIGFQSEPKQIKYKIATNEVKLYELIWMFKSVLFSPSSLIIIQGSPSERRDYIDSIISRIDKAYIKTLLTYNKILKTRNSLLKKISKWEWSKSQLLAWDEQLITYWMQIISSRAQYINQTKSLVMHYYALISKTGRSMEIDYEAISADFFRESLNANQERDIILWNTSVWPHRDDLSILIDAKSMKDYASQWEVRSWILALKYAEIDSMAQWWHSVTLLLDDVFSELDKERQFSLIELSERYQTIITSVDAPSKYQWTKKIIL